MQTGGIFEEAGWKVVENRRKVARREHEMLPLASDRLRLKGWGGIVLAASITRHDDPEIALVVSRLGRILMIFAVSNILTGLLFASAVTVRSFRQNPKLYLSLNLLVKDVMAA